MDRKTEVFNTYDEWFAYASGRATLGEQLKLRPQFRSAASGKHATAKWLKSLTPSDMIQLLLMLDGKAKVNGNSAQSSDFTRVVTYTSRAFGV